MDGGRAGPVVQVLAKSHGRRAGLVVQDLAKPHGRAGLVVLAKSHRRLKAVVRFVDVAISLRV